MSLVFRPSCPPSPGFGLVLVSLATLGGCLQTAGTPELDRLEPDWGWNGESTDVVLIGSDFHPSATATSADAFDVDRQFEAWLEIDGQPVPLEGVSLVDLGQLRARVPAGLPPGRHSVGLRAPSGEETRLEEGFSVSPTRADHLSTQVDTLTHPVLSLARVGVSLVDPDNTPVPEALDVRVRVVGVDDPSSIWFEETLDNQRWDPLLPGIHGTLGAGGSGFVALTREDPGDVWLEFAPEESDSSISGASQFLAFTAGGVTGVEVSLETGSEAPVAGEPFTLRLTLRDELGNPTTGAVASVTLLERCAGGETGFRRTVVFADEHVMLDAYLTRATGQDGCATNGVEVVGQADGASIQGSSRDMVVEPGPPRQLAVDALPGTVQVGMDPLLVVVEVEDEWGNAAQASDGTVSLTDSRSGLETFSCRPLLDGVATCEAWPTRADEELRILASTSGGLEGESGPVSVLPGPVDRLDVATAPPLVVAGGVFDLVLHAKDAWDNPVPIDPTGADAPEIDDGTGSVSCAWVSRVGTEAQERFACIATHAEPAKVLTATLPTGGSGESPAFEVVNGALDRATLDIGSVTGITAGDPLDLSVHALDAWDNPYRVQTVTSVDIADKAGEFVAEPVALDGDGVGSLRLRPTVAWTANQLEALDGSVVLGRSAAFDVVAGAAAGFGVTLPRTWVEAGETVDVVVAAQDAYGNPVPGFSGGALLTSEQGAAAPVEASAFADGLATARLTWDAPVLGDALLASGSGLVGRSAPVDALEDCGAAGPTADLQIGGDSDHVVCRVSGVTPAVSIDASGSLAGDQPLSHVHLALDTDTWTRASGTSTTATWSDVGANTVRAIVVDDAACMDEARARVWVGDNDGAPVGPVTVSAGATSLVAGSTTLGSTTVAVSATDCAGDPSSGGTLGVRADLGRLASGTSTLSPTGAGLDFSLDSSGAGQLDWSMVSTAHDGEAMVHVGTASGSAHGATELEVTGEFAPPTVVDVHPAGTSTGLFSTVSITFSEPMLAASLSPSTVGLTDPTGTPVTDLAVSVDGAVATISLDSPADAGAGVWTLGVGTNARDAAGNRLDGGWTGSSSAFLLTFGLVPDTAPDLTDCVASTPVIRPDGDDGPGDESDDVELSLQATGTPAWWAMEVLDPTGAVVLTEHEPGTSPSTTLSWGGRGTDGAVVVEGQYSIHVTPLDSSWNAGAGCTRPVGVRHRLAAPGAAP